MVEADDTPPIVHAARLGDVEEVLRLVGEDRKQLEATNFVEETALIAAAREGHVVVVRALVEEGAALGASTCWDATALHVAAAKGREEVVAVLLEGGADVLCTGGRKTSVLMAAARSGQLCVVRLLLRRGALGGIDARDADGRTALWLACSEGHTGVAHTLLLAGADHTIKDAGKNTDARTPRQVATDHWMWGCAALLEWWEGEVDRRYMIHRARRVLEDGAILQHAPDAEPPGHLRARRGDAAAMPQVEVITVPREEGGKEEGVGVNDGPMRRRLVEAHLAGYYREVDEEERRATLDFVIRDMDDDLYSELMEG